MTNDEEILFEQLSDGKDATKEDVAFLCKTIDNLQVAISWLEKGMTELRSETIDECKQAIQNQGGYVCDIITSGVLEQLKQEKRG